MSLNQKKSLLQIIGPGMLIAATGVGAGDLATAAFTGNKLGVAILWAVVLGAFFKYILNEGLTRWQLVTGETVLEGAMKRFGKPVQIGFMIYFILWSFLVAAALMSACGAVTHALFPIFEDANTDKIFFGVIHSLLGLILVKLGGYGLFEALMGVMTGLMFFTVVISAILLKPDFAQMLTGLVYPTIPNFGSDSIGWTIALMGGVGGTVTILCYGYWIREEERMSIDDLRICRIDLGVGYVMTAIFGLSMVVIGSQIEVPEGSGSALVIKLAGKLETEIGAFGKWGFLIGAWSTVFTSLFGVWQSVPYLFTDQWNLLMTKEKAFKKVDIRSKTYQYYLYAITFIPMLGLWVGFSKMQKLYAIVGACFMPMLALTLLILNTKKQWIGERHKNKPATIFILFFILFFFIVAGFYSSD